MTDPPAPVPPPPGGDEPAPRHEWLRKAEPDPRVEPEPRWQYEIEAEERARARAARKASRADRLKNVGGPFGFALLLIWKVGRIALVALGKVAILFKIPLLGTVFSGLISIGAYAVFFGWAFAFGLVISLLIHELGHVVAIRHEGMPVKALNFVPFLGAYVLTSASTSDDQQARISIAGPIAGALAAVVIYLVTGNDPLWNAVAYAGFFINLLNLIPIPGLDGGGVGRVFTAGWWLLLAIVLGGVALASGAGFAAVAAIAALVMVYLHRASGFDLDPAAGGIPLGERARAAVLYAGVIAVCAFGMTATFEDRTSDLVQQYGSTSPIVAAAHTP